MSDSHLYPNPGWDELQRARRMLAARGPRPLADLTDAELLRQYQLAKAVDEADVNELPPEVLAEIAAMSDDALVAEYESVRRELGAA